MKKSLSLICTSLAIILFSSCTHEPVKICPTNPHYFYYKNRPLVLITSDHHYGAVIDKDFDYKKYLDYLSSKGLNLTRIYPGGMFESPDKYQKGNPLGPRQGRLLLPWAYSTDTGANPLLAAKANVSYKFDLEKWNPVYFTRLRNFVAYARLKNIIVEVPFFNGMYADCWELNALYYKNNIQNIGHYSAANCGYFTTTREENKEVIKYQAEYVKKITRELNEFDNVIYDICDEPSLQGLPDGNITIMNDSIIIPWIDAMKDAYLEAESTLPNKHLLGQTVQNLSPDLSARDWCKWLPTEYCRPAAHALELDYKCNKPIVDVESNFYGISLTKNPYNAESVRLEGWWFMLAGGAGCINLNGEFHRGQETGGTVSQNQIIPQKKILMDFMNSLDLNRISSFNGFKPLPAGTICKALAVEGKQYAFYIFHGRFEPEWGSHFLYDSGNYSDTLDIQFIPLGNYKLEWIDPSSGKVILKDSFDSNSGKRKLVSPQYGLDIALRIVLAK